ncbi:MAG: hypothetical protein JWR22_771 [Herminiimonas sp.]|nr:hypothetical protein [Herminiimonas sp.]
MKTQIDTQIDEPKREVTRVALISQHFAEYAGRLAKALAQELEVLLVLNEDNARSELGADWKKQFDVPSLKLLPLPKARSIAAVLRNFFTVWSRLRAFRADVIHCQEGGVWDELIPVLLWQRNTPLILTVHDPCPHAGADRERISFSRHRLYHAMLRMRCDAAIVHGDTLGARLRALNGRFETRTFTVPHGVLGPEDIGPATDWTKGNLLFFGRLQSYKGLGIFIEAVRELERRGIPVRGVVAGRGPDLDQYRSQLSESKLFELHERFIPPDEVPCLFMQANAVVLPYMEGTQSGVAAMALGYGRPIVASRVGAIPDLVVDDINGLLVRPGAVDELVRALERVIVDQRLATRLAHNSLALGQGALSWRQIAVRTRAVYCNATAFKFKTPHSIGVTVANKDKRVVR